MSEPRKYVLELSAEEAEVLCLQGVAATPAGATVVGKLRAMRDRVAADREEDDLRLPWRIWQNAAGFWYANDNTGSTPISKRAAMLRSAAPELLDALKAAAEWPSLAGRWSRSEWDQRVQPSIDRALRKVDTGIPEEP